MAYTSTLGCQVDPFCLSCYDNEDAAPDGGATLLPPAECLRADAACPEETEANDPRLQSDPCNCGGCGQFCALPRAISRCADGRCVIDSCLPGSADLDNKPDNGCEAACPAHPAPDSPFCDGPDCCDGTDNDCDGTEAEDHDVMSDPRNCGGCAHDCATFPCPHLCEAPFAEMACVDGQCQLVRCANGYEDRDGDMWTGCEYRPISDSCESSPEKCNGRDDDCDGLVDEGIPVKPNSCGNAHAHTGLGHLTCHDGEERCVDVVPPQQEICDDRDNDHNGEVDDGAACNVPGAICDNGRCRMPCAEGSDRLPCPPDMECRDGYCAGALCRDQTCGACQTCDLSTGLCVDACAGIHCPTGLCHCGRCVAHSCYYMDCPEGSFCRDGRCVTDPCQRTDCGAQGCTMGQCFPLCPAEGCPFHQSCHQGTCVADLCGGEVCPVGQCNPIDGNCSRVCDEVTCLEGMSCDINTGTCTDDRCVGVHCPGGSHCVEGSCYALPPDNVVDAGPVVDSGPQTWVLATGGGGGGGCSSTGTTGQSPVGWVLGFFLVLFFRRKVA